VTIGSQVWMAENLRVTHYRNGDPIPNVTDGETWFGLTTGAYRAYNDDDNNTATYGLLYNWFAVDDSRNIAPAGWHVANDDEWTIFINDLGGYAAAGGKMKEVGTTHWQSPNTGATNVSGFSALPGGSADWGWGGLGSHAFFWSTTPYISNDAWCRVLGYDYSRVYRDIYDKNLGHSVRCVRD